MGTAGSILCLDLDGEHEEEGESGEEEDGLVGSRHGWADDFSFVYISSFEFDGFDC